MQALNTNFNFIHLNIQIFFSMYVCCLIISGPDVVCVTCRKAPSRYHLSVQWPSISPSPCISLLFLLAAAAAAAPPADDIGSDSRCRQCNWISSTQCLCLSSVLARWLTGLFHQITSLPAPARAKKYVANRMSHCVCAYVSSYYVHPYPESVSTDSSQSLTFVNVCMKVSISC